MNAEALPVVVVALLLASVGGADTATVVMDGDQRIEGGDGAVVVAGGTATVPADTTTDQTIYVAGGTAVIEGTVDADVVVLQGALTVASGGEIRGTLEQYGGAVAVEAGAAVDDRSGAPVSPGANPGSTLEFAVVEALAFAALGLLAGDRLGAPLATAGRAATDHPVVSLTVGGLVGLTALAVAVFMAFTLVLLPVAVLGLLGVAVVAAYGVLALGRVVGDRLGLDAPRHATAAGAAVVAVGLRALGFVPVVGGLVPLLVVATGFGAVLVTYLGTKRFEPAVVPPLGGE